jgi:hypothetical protein
MKHKYTKDQQPKLETDTQEVATELVARAADWGSTPEELAAAVGEMMATRGVLQRAELIEVLVAVTICAGLSPREASAALEAAAIKVKKLAA